MIRPSDIPTSAIKAKLDDAETVIDLYLLKNYEHGKRLYVNLPHYVPIPFRDILLQRYRDNGWCVKFEASGVDGLPEGPYFVAKGDSNA